MSKGFTHETTHNISKEWYTPIKIFDALGIEFDLDPCSPGKKIVPWVPAKRHLTIEDDGLTAHWEGNIWLNPPYGSDTPAWLEHLSVAYECGIATGIALVFARSSTQWFHTYVQKATAICFIKGRIKFVPGTDASKYLRDDYKLGGMSGAASM